MDVGGVGGVGIDASAVTFRSTVPSEITGKGIKNEKLSQPGADAADSRLVSEYCQIRVAIISIQCGAGEFDLPGPDLHIRRVSSGNWSNYCYLGDWIR